MWSFESSGCRFFVENRDRHFTKLDELDVTPPKVPHGFVVSEELSSSVSELDDVVVSVVRFSGCLFEIRS